MTSRFEGLVNSIKGISSLATLAPVRYKPLFSSYNSCIDAFRDTFPQEFSSLGLEPLPLYGPNGEERFTQGKLSTLLHQSETILAILKGMQPASARESLAWYWHNTHSSVLIYFAVLLFGVFVAGTLFSETTLYKKTIGPFIIEYMSLKTQQQTSTTASEPPTQNITPKKSTK